MKSAIIALIIALSPFNAINTQIDSQDTSTGQIEPNTATIEIVYEDNIDLITRLSEEKGFETEIALKIADCESKTGKYKINWEGSSAKGIYQFTDKTWKNYCDGDVMDDYDNIRCFMELYEKHPNWWKCKA